MTLARLTVMVVDDEPIVGRRLRATLEKLGARVEVFEDPRRALARLAEVRFDAVVADLRMPGVGGLDIVRAARRGEGTRVIVITGFAGPDTVQQALAEGAHEVLAKPFRAADLVAAVARAAAARDATAPPPEGD